MANTLFKSTPFNAEFILALIRILIGFFLIVHGYEVFDKTKMADYGTWIPPFGTGSAITVSYIGKSLELIAGILLTIGLFTRLASIALIATLWLIAFGIGEGRIFAEEQHPFLLGLFGVLYLFMGGGRWSLDARLFGR